VVITENVRVDFSEPMNQTSAESAFSLADNATWTYLSGTFSWVINTLVFDPDALLQPGTEYTANVTMTAKDDSNQGNSLLALQNWWFTTMSGADLEPPTIWDVTVVPSSQEIGDNVNISAVIHDNVGVDHALVNVTLPGGGFLEDPMDHDVANDRYYVNRSYPELGTYDLTVWAEDTNGLQNSSVGQFDIVDTTPPVIAHIPVSLAHANDTINITATVTDNFGLAAVDPVRLDYVNVTGIAFNITTLSIGGDGYQGQIPAQLVAGDVTYFVWASDSLGNEIRTSWYTITVVTQDIFPPEILGVQALPSPQERYGDVNITATIRDLSGIYGAWVIVDLPDASSLNLSLTVGQNDVYYVENVFGLVGTYDFTVWAEDNGGMGNTSSGHSFEIVDTTPPAAPTGLSVSAGDDAGTLDITWVANTELDIAGYDLYRSDTGANNTFSKVNTALITGTSYTDDGLEDNTTYYYMLKAVDDEELESEFSHPADGTTIIPGAEEEADYMWLYALIAILVILVVVLAAVSAARKKPSEEEEDEEELEELDEVGEEYTAEEKGEEIAEEEIAETSEDEPPEPP
ncbi:MAG: Ig-like domain-containing protein, partial [Candidatus Thermoplasmatota archaeon]|nr:Ig-like domain-containing protein [Candidatus Thermoplasmatota archaeon]